MATSDRDQVVASFPDFAVAREAIERLENAGIDGSAMEFDEQSRKTAEHRTESPSDHDERVMRRAARNVFSSALIGGLIGGVIGLVVALSMGWSAAAVIGMVLAIGAPAAAVGAVAGGVAGSKQTESWSDTFIAPSAPGPRLHIAVATPQERELVAATVKEAGGAIESDARR